MKHHDIFDMHECFKCPSWRGLFEKPKQLSGWIRFQLWAVHGYRSKEMALLAEHAARSLRSLYRRNGALWMSRYLKTSRAVLYKALGGISKDPPYRVIYSASYAPSAKMVPVSLTRSGIPRFVLPIHRQRMICGADKEKWVRTYATILDLFKLIVIETPVDVSSIITESMAPPLFLPDGPIVHPVRGLRMNPQTREYLRTVPLQLGYSSRLMWTAGPNTAPGVGSLAMLLEDAQAFLDKHIPLELQLLDCLFLPSERKGRRGSFGCRVCRLFLSFLLQIVAPRPPTDPVILGRVGRKVEPAGKTRLFMILDSITQRLLHPLHKWVYGLLRSIPSDGTFAQLAPLERLKGKTDTFYSFDLRSATDRLPAEECVALLTALVGPDVTIAWRCLLYRPFVVPRTMSVTPKVPDVIFTAGTPLGSLSAWGVFTLFHHLLVQQAAYFATHHWAWFSSYAVLGDDLVIGDPDVARQYRKLLRRIGVEISPEKSVSSRNGSLEFASRFIYRGVDVSPISFRSLAAARESPGAVASFFVRLEAFRDVRFSEYFRLHGAGYRILPLASLPYGRLNRLPKRWFQILYLRESLIPKI